jgi:hypothetical protein
VFDWRNLKDLPTIRHAAERSAQADAQMVEKKVNPQGE